LSSYLLITLTSASLSPDPRVAGVPGVSVAERCPPGPSAYNAQYQQIAAVKAGNGLTTDGHEFLITPWNTALILSYDTATADLTSIGGPANQTVINGIVRQTTLSADAL
jgi:hypothetical protein